MLMATSQREDDEMERLLARVDQQSSLISMLKERADKVQEEVSVLKMDIIGTTILTLATSPTDVSRPEYVRFFPKSSQQAARYAV